VRAGTAAAELVALCALIVTVGMLSPQLTPTAAGLIAGLGLAGIVGGAALFPTFAGRLARRGGNLLPGVPVPLAAVRRLGFPVVALGFFLVWTFVYMALWAVHSKTAFQGLQKPLPYFADFFYYAVSTAFISPPGDIIARSRGARSATMIEMLSGASLVTVYLSSFAAFPRLGPAREPAEQAPPDPGT
jgi:hypothetical protein